MSAAAMAAATPETASLAFRKAAAFFEARWALNRTIRRRADGALQLTCQGEATLRPVRADDWGPRRLLRYEENGTMSLANSGYESNFRKAYFYELSETRTGGLDLQIFFDYRNGADPLPEDLYCVFDLSNYALGQPILSTEHLCVKDLYTGQLVFEDPSHWHLRWEVVGPQKDFVFDSFFERLPPPPGL
eukprot:gnl/TRDRNA2_/TRDRNA2_161081_c0_seq1.p1 gnl/TRDRNA2_/TRDRNA2_161081_c0~~gnl/TRDRNA2_/TRDRNA2_161081_c0_seq1.p1  ORF type:complete len:189 (+),score=38.98 gnl/TRDRNA2_/TRDRNA2_161081_c0_seq1:81-647(+)